MSKKLTTKQQAVAAELFEQHLPMATRIAVKISLYYPVPLQELIEEAQGVLATMVSRWFDDKVAFDSSKQCKPSTRIYRKINWELINYCNRRKQRAMTSLSTHKGCQLEIAKPQHQWLESLLHTLTTDAQIVINTILQAPKEIAADIDSGRANRARKAIRNYITKHGWTQDRLDEAWQEVQLCLA